MPPSAVTHISQKSVPKSRFLTASPSREKPLVGIGTLHDITNIVGYGTRLLPSGQCHQLKHPTFKGVLYFGKIWLFYAALFVGQPYSGALGQRHCVIDSASPKTASSALLLTLSQSFRRLFVSALKSSCFGSYVIRISSQGCCEPLRFRRAVQIPALLPDLQETSSHRNPEVLHPAYIL